MRFQDAKSKPENFFDHPEDVMSCDELNGQEKRAILSKWKNDVKLFSVGHSESAAGDRQPLLQSIEQALSSIESKAP